MLRRLATIAGIATAAVVVAIPRAHAQACANCMFEPGFGYVCVESPGGYGYGCFTTGDVPCTFVGLCGGGRSTANGSAYPLHPKDVVGTRGAGTTRPAKKIQVDVVASRGRVKRGCGGAIISRQYRSAVRDRLRAATQRIVL